MSWSQQAQRAQLEGLVFYFAFKHPRVRWYAKVVAACTAGYLLSPIQLIPSYIPVIGLLDDFLVLFLGIKLLRRLIPADVLTECRQRAEAVERRRKEDFKPAIGGVRAIVMISLWLLGAIIASALIVRHLRP